MVGLTFDISFIRTVPGMAMAAEVIIGFIGGIIGIVLASGFEAFLFWTTVFISGLFLFTHVTNLTQSVESRFPIFMKLHLGYLVVWSGLLVISLIICIVGFHLILIVVAMLLLAFLIDLFFKWRKWRAARAAAGETAPAAPTSPDSVESGGKY